MNVLVIDTETTNDIKQPLPYDVGYAVVNIDTSDIIVKRSFVVAEIWFDKELMEQAYFAEKIPQYWKDIKENKRIIKGIWNIRKQIQKDMKENNVVKVGAYNMAFDKRATNNDVRYITGSLIRWFFPYDTEFFCIWSMACSSILHTKEFVEFAKNNNYISDKGNVRTNAEVCYKYITGKTDFAESHTGLEDVMIEVSIMLFIINSKMNFNSDINYGCWRWVQKVGA
jgi:hypothetical protein